MTVGVRHDETAGIERALLNRSSGYLRPTWAQSLHDLVPGTPFEWTFGPDIDPEVLQDLCETLRVSAMPILQASLSLEAILEHLGRRPAGVEYDLPIVLALLGRRDEARAAVAGELEWLRPRSYDATQTYSAFADRFERWLRDREQGQDAT